jgi:hypothetical protein
VARFVEFFAKQKDNLPSLRIIAPKWAEAQVEELAKPLEDASWKVERDNYSKVGEKVGDRNILHIVFADLNSPIAFGSAANILSEASLPWLALPLTNEKPFRGELNILFDFINKGGLWVGVNTTQNMLLSLLKLWPAGIKSKALEEVAGKK